MRWSNLTQDMPAANRWKSTLGWLSVRPNASMIRSLADSQSYRSHGFGSILSLLISRYFAPG